MNTGAHALFRIRVWAPRVEELGDTLDTSLQGKNTNAMLSPSGHVLATAEYARASGHTPEFPWVLSAESFPEQCWPSIFTLPSLGSLDTRQAFSRCHASEVQGQVRKGAWHGMWGVVFHPLCVGRGCRQPQLPGSIGAIEISPSVPKLHSQGLTAVGQSSLTSLPEAPSSVLRVLWVCRRHSEFFGQLSLAPSMKKFMHDRASRDWPKVSTGSSTRMCTHTHTGCPFPRPPSPTDRLQRPRGSARATYQQTGDENTMGCF